MKRININIKGDTSWANASEETLKELLDEHYSGKISIFDHMDIGDERKVKLVGPELDSEEVIYVLSDKEKFNIVSNNKKAAFVVDLKDLLPIAVPMENNVNKFCNLGFENCYLDRWLNTIYKESVPLDIFKEFIFSVSEDKYISRMFTLHSEYEIFREYTYGINDYSMEIEYYKNGKNRIKYYKEVSHWYWLRSASTFSNSFCCVNECGYEKITYGSESFLIAPFGVI